MYERTNLAAQQTNQALGGAMAGGLESCQPVPMPLPELSREQTRLYETVDSLSNLVSQLCKTLQPVTRQDPHGR